MTDDSLVHLHRDFRTNHSIDEGHLNFCCVVGTPSVISRDSRLSCLPLEVEELIEFVKSLLAELFFILVSMISVRFGMILSIFPEII